MWEELSDLGGKLFLDERRYMRNEREMEKDIGLRRKHAMVIFSYMGWKNEKLTYVNQVIIFNRRCDISCVMFGD